jgi:hypothetical protein
MKGGSLRLVGERLPRGFQCQRHGGRQNGLAGLVGHGWTGGLRSVASSVLPADGRFSCVLLHCVSYLVPERQGWWLLLLFGTC